jgi:predicted PurR-regulated permease PerM
MASTQNGPEGDRSAPEQLASRLPLSLVARWAAAATVGVLAVLLLAYGVYIVRGILVLVLLGLFVAVSLDPAVRFLVRRRVPRPLAVTIVVLVLVALTAGFFWSIVPPMVGQGTKLIQNLPDYLRKLGDESRTVRAVTDRYHLTDKLTSLISEIPARLAGGAFGAVRRVLGLLASTLTVLVLTIYFMADLPRLQRGVVNLFPRRRRPRANEVVNIVVDKVGDYMIGNIVISIFAGVSSFICLEIVRVPYALPLAVAVAVTDLIPMIGATLGAIICVVASVFTVSLWPRAVIVLLFFIAYQQLENYLIAPRVLRNTVDLSSVAVLLSALIGGALLGVLGAIMAIPVAATIKVVMSPAVTALGAADATGPPGVTAPPGGMGPPA